MKFLISFNSLVLFLGAIYFLAFRDLEFIIYVVVIAAIYLFVLKTLKYTMFPVWLLWFFSAWGIAHILGGAIVLDNAVLFAYKIYPFLDLGGEFYILKYDQLVHMYLYGVISVMIFHVMRMYFKIREKTLLVFLIAVLGSAGIGTLNEIMEFLVATNIPENGVGGYENTMLDISFNLLGALIATTGYLYFSKDEILGGKR